MPGYLVELLENEKMTLTDQKVGAQVVWAGSEAQARAIAKASRRGDSSAAWDNATVTDLSTVQSFAHLSMVVHVYDAVPVIGVAVDMPAGNVVASGSIDTAGTGYSANDILTVATGTKTRAATFRVTTVGGSGEVTGIELVDPGDAYTVDPTLDGVATTVLPDNGSGCKLDLTMVANDYKNLVGAMVTALNATAIDGAACDFGDGATGSLTIAAIADGIGDKNAHAAFYVTADPAKNEIPELLGTMTDQGIAAAVLNVLLVASPVAPKSIGVY